MSHATKAKTLDFLLELIINENTGPAEDLCQRIYVSVPTLHRYLSDLRDLGHEIEYSRTRQTYILIKNENS
ncbi:MAG: HTH domain-containing protein [Bacteroidales bacterium]|nr:HTH domain-containing protein [Bacteroidales bacterium]